MPKSSKDTAPRVQDAGVMVGRYAELDGYTVGFESFREDADAAPIFVGLPDDRCQCPHWGYVVEGSLTYRFADHEETVQAGEAFYLPPGHVPVGNAPNSVVVQFSPTDELRRTEKVLFENLQSSQSPS